MTLLMAMLVLAAVVGVALVAVRTTGPRARVRGYAGSGGDGTFHGAPADTAGSCGGGGGDGGGGGGGG
jgi:hypothetical protein